MYALVDGNNFYVSCERVFRPSLNGRPVVVLSNNDGCAISRSNEAKNLGVAMGAPWFKMRELAEQHGIIALSANFGLYGDMSDRMMTLAAGLGPEQEIYSIDESFIGGLDGIRDVTGRARKVRERILQWTGIPCGIGIAATKTLAKLANHVAKSAERKPGSYPAELAQVCNLSTLPRSIYEAALARTDVADVWGVGRKISAQLHAEGVTNVLELSRLDPALVRRRWSVVLERTVRELQGMPCVPFEDAPAPKKEIASTRSFGTDITSLPPLVEAVSEFATRAAEKLRAQSSVAGQVLVFVRTSPFRGPPQYARTVVIPLRRPTADTAVLVRTAVQGAQRVFAAGYELVKAGVMLLDLSPASRFQHELDLEDEDAYDAGRARLMTALDTLNNRYGKGTVHMASTGTAGDARSWAMRQERRTPQYTTRWADVPIARA